MRNNLYIIPLLFVIACASTDEKRRESWETWKGKSVFSIKDHPYFKNLKVTKLRNESGIETWIYKDQTPFPTSAYCSSLGGCQGRPFYNCESAFSIENGIIQGFEQEGVCPDIKTIEAKNK